jgi:hypothetical protein
LIFIRGLLHLLFTVKRLIDKRHIFHFDIILSIMSHSLVKKLDKIVSKLGNKSKENKMNSNEVTDAQVNADDAAPTAADGNVENSHESILQRMKGHLGHAHGSGKGEHQNVEGAPPLQTIINDLKDSPFKGKLNLHIN